jgi:hypothetical protein
VALAAVGLLAAPGTATAGAHTPGALTARTPEPIVIRIRSNDHRVAMSDARFRPGVTEFRVGKTAHRGSSLLILQTDDLPGAFAKLNKAFGGGPGSANAMKAFNHMVTIYGGGASGARWQVNLRRGSYYMLDSKTNKVTTFTVKGDRRGAKMMRPDSEVWATKQNQFKTSGNLMGNWVGFTNDAREIHFLEADRVANGTTAKRVRKSLTSPRKPKFFRPGGFFFEVQSPGVRTVHYQPVRPGKYLLICWMPSQEQDGMPHALMGMWDLARAS